MSSEGRHAGGWDAPVGNLAVCLAGNRMRKQMEDRGGFTASWCRSAVGQSHLPGMRRSDPEGADAQHIFKPQNYVLNSMKVEDF